MSNTMFGSGNDLSEKIHGTSIVLPQIPSENPLSHEGFKWKESAETRIAGPLLVVAQGKIPEAALAIKLHDLTELPELDPSHPQFERRKELRIKLSRENEYLNEKRKTIVLTTWTELYKALAAASEQNAPTASSSWSVTCLRAMALVGVILMDPRHGP